MKAIYFHKNTSEFSFASQRLGASALNKKLLRLMGINTSRLELEFA